MEKFVYFITNHWILSTLWIVCVIIFLINEFIQSRLTAKSVTAEKAVLLINHQHAIVLDIRSDAAFAEAHILGAEHLPKQHLEKKIKQLQKDLEKPVIVVCNLGQDAAKFATELQQKGFVQAVILKGGIQAWKSSGLPLVKS